MMVFVTGATGYLGRAVARELVAGGHDVTGLTRSAEKAEGLESLGVRAVVGDLRDTAAYGEEIRSADALIHLAAEASSSKAEADRAAVDALLAGAEGGSPSCVVYTSGCFVLGETGSAPAHEDASTKNAPAMVAWRPAHEARVLAADSQDLATSVIRPGMVYGGRGGTFDMFFESAESGAAEFVGDGANRWSPVYLGDVAALYRMVVEGRGRGIFHCAEPAALVGRLAMAASAAAGAGGATRRIRLDEARESLGAFADALTMDQVVGCRRALDFGWAPSHRPFLESADDVYREWQSSG